MAETFEHEGSTTRRLDRVESDVSALTSAFGGLRGEVGDLRGDVRSLSQILTRIETSIAANETREAQARIAKEPNAVAVGTAMFTIIAALISGAWLVSGELATLHTTDVHRERQLMIIERKLERLEQRNDK